MTSLSMLFERSSDLAITQIIVLINDMHMENKRDELRTIANPTVIDRLIDQ